MIAGIGCLSVIFQRVPPEALLDVAIFASLGFGIGRKSRVCAVLALIFYGSSQIYAYWIGRGSWNIVLVVIIIFLFVNTVRAAFKYHHFKKSTDQTQADQDAGMMNEEG